VQDCFEVIESLVKAKRSRRICAGMYRRGCVSPVEQEKGLASEFECCKRGMRRRGVLWCASCVCRMTWRVMYVCVCFACLAVGVCDYHLS